MPARHEHYRLRTWPLRNAALLTASFVMGCGADPTGTASAPGGSAEVPARDSGACVGSEIVAAKRVVRLSEHQLWNSYSALFGESGAAIITANEDAAALVEREFPPISGDVGVSEALFSKIDRLAQAAMNYVSENAATLTPCGATPSDAACVQQYLLSFAERAFRHPLSVDERNALTGLFWTELTAAGATPAQALRYGVYAVLSSPSFIYRTEFGADATAAGALTPYELASAISFFLTDRPPDAELLAAAASGALGTPDQVRAQATRLLEAPEARANLEGALIEYFSLSNARAVILNPEATPGFTLSDGLRASIIHEGELYLKNVLWSGPLGRLLTSQETWTRSEIATEVYGVAAPSEVDADGFGLVELPADRAGLLTLSTFLLSGARSTGSSPVTRGLAVSASLVCEVNQPFPEVLDPETGELGPDPTVAAAIAALADRSELEKAEFRAGTPTCASCHQTFDAYGMVLEPYDAVGRHRTVDLEGRPIDQSWTSTTLPESVGGALVTNAVDTARELVNSGALERCLVMNFINFALGEVSKGGANNTDLASAPQTGSCAVKGVVDALAGTDRSFASLLREIAASDTLAVRTGGR